MPVRISVLGGGFLPILKSWRMQNSFFALQRKTHGWWYEVPGKTEMPLKSFVPSLSSHLSDTCIQELAVTQKLCVI